MPCGRRQPSIGRAARSASTAWRSNASSPACRTMICGRSSVRPADMWKRPSSGSGSARSPAALGRVAQGTCVRLQRDRAKGTPDRPSSSSKIFPFGHQMRVFEPAIAQVPSFGATETTGPTHPVPSFVPFCTVVCSANADEDERAIAAARSSRRMKYSFDQGFVHGAPLGTVQWVRHSRASRRSAFPALRGGDISCMAGETVQFCSDAPRDPA